MIQRIQTVFLLVSLMFIAAMFFFPSAVLQLDTNNDSQSVAQYCKLTLNGLSLDQTTEQASEAPVSVRSWSLTIFGLLICWLHVAIIFLYRRRVLQMRLCVYCIILSLGLWGVLGYIAISSNHAYYQLPIVFPAVAAILQFLAFRGIRKDELLVQMSNRLR